MRILAAKALRKILIQCGLRCVADCIVPEHAKRKDVSALRVKMDDVQAFMDAQKLPRLLDVTPLIHESDISMNNNDILGSGGYGSVFKGLLAGKPVAIKTLFVAALGESNAQMPASAIKMMKREATIMCSLNHPNILRIRGVVPQRGWIVMELCEGGALDELLSDTEEALDAHTQMRICAEIATGIAYLHMRDVSIVHGDLKAGNVLLTKDRYVRICDFGMSEAKNRSKTMTTASAGGSQGNALTVAWSAPELFQAESKSFATDVYALGVTFWEVFEQQSPFRFMPEAAIVNQVLAGQRPRLSDTPPNVKQMIEVCWAQEHKERPSADKVAYIMQNYAEMERMKAEAEVEESVKEVESVDVGPRSTQPTTQIQFADGTRLTPEQIQAKD